MDLSPYEKMAFCLQEARENADKTQKDAADFLGCTYQAISNYERAKTKIDSVSLLRLLLYYQVDIYDFLEKCGFEVMHKIRASAPEVKNELVEAYSNADPGLQKSVRILLGISDKAENHHENFTTSEKAI